MNWSVFISHSTKDGKIAKELCSYLESNGKKCFIAPRDIQGGREYAGEILKGIENSETMVLLLSANSNESPHVLREVERAVSKSIPIIIYKLEDVELSKSMEYFLMAHQWMDAKKTGDFENVLKVVNGITNPNLTDDSDAKTKEAENNNTSNVKSNNKKIIAAIAVLLFSVAMIGTFLLFMHNNDNGNVPAENQTSDEKHTSEDNRTLEENQTSGENNTSEENQTSVTIEVGDIVKLGTYNDEKIEWMVLRLSEDGKEAVLISKNILSMKPYDVAESGRFNYDKDGNSYVEDPRVEENQELQIQVRGNSDWSVSNIRTWLNSSQEFVKYQDQAPDNSAIAEKVNGYVHEPGFLYGFGKEEMAAIKEVENTTTGNASSGKDFIVTKDKVYLLSLDELQWFEDAGMSILAKPTQAAIDRDGTTWYEDDMEIFLVTAHYWWLREPVKEASGRCYIVGNGNPKYPDQLIYDKDVGLEGFGIRPAITVYVDKLADIQD